jgi:hypothetical protein
MRRLPEYTFSVSCGVVVSAHQVSAPFWIGPYQIVLIHLPYSVSTWALEEARRRLEAEGVLPDPEKKD